MPNLFPTFVHWAARGLALLVAGFCLYLFLAEVIAPHSRAPVGFTEWGQIALLVTVVVGMLLAWKWELPGAVVSLLALATWATLVPLNRFPDIIVLLAAPGLLFISDWALHYGLEHNRHP